MNTLNSEDNQAKSTKVLRVKKIIHSDHLTRKEAADFLRCSPRTLDSRVAEGKIPYYKLGDSKTSKVLFKIDDLRAYLEKFRIEI